MVTTVRAVDSIEQFTSAEMFAAPSPRGVRLADLRRLPSTAASGSDDLLTAPGDMPA